MCTFFGALGALGGTGQYFIGGGASLEGPALDDEATCAASGATISSGTISIRTDAGGGGSADAGGVHSGIALSKLGRKVPDAPAFLFPWAFFDGTLGVVNSRPSARRSRSNSIG
jgi:hypothetical protein